MDPVSQLDIQLASSTAVGNSDADDLDLLWLHLEVVLCVYPTADSDSGRHGVAFGLFLSMDGNDHGRLVGR